MQNSHNGALAPCIVDDGILINKKDMRRALETLETVKYTYIVDGSIISQGEGVVVKVFASPDTSTLVVNGCLFLNTLSFDYVHFFTQGNSPTTMELVENGRVLQLIPIEDDNRRLNKFNREIFAAERYGEETPAELFDEIDDDDRF